jgi:hypothetical protein
MQNAFATNCCNIRCAKATNYRILKRFAGLAMCAGAVCLSLLPASVARADAMNAVYRGRDLGMALADAVSKVQATGSSRAPHTTLSISGSGDQFMFTEVSFDTIEIETASYKDLDFDTVDVRKVGELGGRYGITLAAAPGSVNDHIVGSGKVAAAAADHDSPLGYMDFWLVDPDMSRVRHLADLLATIGARLREQRNSVASATDPATPAHPVAAVPTHAVVLHVEEAAENPDDIEKVPVPRASPAIASAGADDAVLDHDAVQTGKCLFAPAKRQKHGKLRSPVAAGWSNLTQGMTSQSGRISYRIAALHGPDDHQAIQFYLGNGLPVLGTVVARVILTSSNGSQQAEDIGLNSLPGHSMKTDESLRLTPFEDSSCITDVDVTEVHACPLPSDEADTEDAVSIFHCSEDAAAGTTKLNGITYVSGREPKVLIPPASARASSAASSVTSMASLAATGATAQTAAQSR